MLPLNTKKQSGTALITAMLIVALSVTMMTPIVTRLYTQTHLDKNYQLMAETQQYAFAAESLAIKRLELFLHRGTGQNLQAYTDKQLKSFPIDDNEGNTIGNMSLDVTTIQGKFNINGILTAGGTVNPQMLNGLRRLLQFHGLPANYAYAVLDWIDADDKRYDPVAGAEKSHYLSEGYAPENKPIKSLSSLSLIRLGNNRNKAALQEKLQEFKKEVSALPAGTKVDINTAPKNVLLALYFTPKQVNEIEQLRTRRPISNMLQINSVKTAGRAFITQQENLFSFSSEYFQVDSVIKYKKATNKQRILLGQNETGQLNILARELMP